MWAWGWGPCGCPSVPTPHLFSVFSWNCATNFIVHGAPTEHGVFERYWATARVLTRVGLLGEATWEEARGGRARRATIKALPAALHRPRPYGLASSDYSELLNIG